MERKIFKVLEKQVIEIEFCDLKQGDLFRIVDDDKKYLDDVKNKITRLACSDPFLDKNNKWSIMTEEVHFESEGEQ